MIKFSRFRWVAMIRAVLHQRRAARANPGTVHAVFALEGVNEDLPSFGKHLGVACTCSAAFWFNRKFVDPTEFQGDWAKPWRDNMGIKARAVNHDRQKRKASR